MNSGEAIVHLTSGQLSILQHALGVDEFGQGQSYRNHFVTGNGSKDYDDCVALAAAGLMVHRPGSELTGGNDLFAVTEEGRGIVREQSPKPPKISAARRRYLEYLEVGDLYDGFGHYLRSRQREKKETGRRY